MKKIIMAILYIGLSSNHLSAQDDVSVMDLKETTYYLMKDVRDMKEKQRVFLGKTTTITQNGSAEIARLNKEVEKLQKTINEMRAKELISDYRPSARVSEYARKK